MPVNFTDSPSNGDTIIGGGLTYTYVSANSRWETAAGAGLNTEEVQDVVGAMFTGNTETGIAATYQDSDGTVDLVASGGGLTTTVYATMALLIAATGMSTGDLAYVTANNNLYLYSVNGWFLVATVANTSPTAITGVSATYTLAIDGTATVITAVSTDPEGFPLTWSSAVTTGSLTNGGGATATVSQNENVFTITPTTTEAYAGTFSITFSATDGVNGAVNAVGAFTLEFTIDWSSTTQQTKLTASNAGSDDYFGFSVGISSNTAVVGAKYEDTEGSNAGAAYIFTRSGTTWTQQQMLAGSDTEAVDYFGNAVAIDGDTVVVGAYGEDTGGSSAGAAYIFTRSGTTWTQQQKLASSDLAAGDKFGWSVAIDGDTVVVGASDKVSDTGAAYVFTRSGTTWSQQQKLTASDAATGDAFGWSVDISEDTVVVGAYEEDGNYSSGKSGSAYTFIRSGTTWSQQQKIMASDWQGYDKFGWDVSIDGDTLAVGAYGEDTGGNEAGAAYIFTRSGTTWSQQQKLQASNRGGADYFGRGVAVQGDALVVGATNEDSGEINAGAAYIFTRDGTTWTQQKFIQASDRLESGYWGSCCSIDSNTIIMGMDPATWITTNGGAYIFIGG